MEQELTQPLEAGLYDQLVAQADSRGDYYIDHNQFGYARLVAGSELLPQESVHFVHNARARRELCEQHPDDRVFELKPTGYESPVREFDRSAGQWVACERTVVAKVEARARVSALSD